MCELIIVFERYVTVTIRVRGQIIYSEQFNYDEDLYSILLKFRSLLIYSSIEIFMMPDIVTSVPSNNVCVGSSGQFLEVINHDDYLSLGQIFPKAKFYNMLESLATLGSYRVRSTEYILEISDNGESTNIDVNVGRVVPIDVDKVLSDEITLVPLELQAYDAPKSKSSSKILFSLAMACFYVTSISTLLYFTCSLY